MFLPQFMPLRAHSISAVHPAAPDTVPCPVSDSPVDSAAEKEASCLCLGDFVLHGNGLRNDRPGWNYCVPQGQYVYDQENRLSSTAGMSYTYDGNGERVLKSNTSTGAAVKRYWSMGGNTLAEGNGSGNLTAEYIYFGGQRVARIDLPANTVHYYLSDHLGSTSIVASAAGVIEEESDYYPFGTEVVIEWLPAREEKNQAIMWRPGMCLHPAKETGWSTIQLIIELAIKKEPWLENVPAFAGRLLYS
jgi:hypothetical protein